jgi:hypothetical protein
MTDKEEIHSKDDKEEGRRDQKQRFDFHLSGGKKSCRSCANPIRKSPTFQREGSYRALNFGPRCSAGLSNGANRNPGFLIILRFERYPNSNNLKLIIGEKHPLLNFYHCFSLFSPKSELITPNFG